MWYKKRFLLMISAMAPYLYTAAQQQKIQKDPSGFVTKYDPQFKGIGPEVYLLPAPRSKEEILTDSYHEKKGFYEAIAKQLDFQNLLEEHKPSNNLGYLKQNFSPFPDGEEKWNELIQKLEANNNAALAAGLGNEYALHLIQKGDISKAINALTRAQSAVQTTNLIIDKAIIAHNLANVLLFSGNAQEAMVLQETYLKQVTTDKNMEEQANTLVNIALAEAKNKNYRAAENTIIRRAIPLYNKSKYYPGKVQAWIKLAKIYQLQNKHTEAQWFLIQARDLAQSKTIVQDLPEIEYMLAFSKYEQENYRVAKAEFENARKLANEEHNKLLQLAISDRLGNIYLMMGETKAAESELKQYWDLRKELFPAGNL